MIQTEEVKQDLGKNEEHILKSIKRASSRVMKILEKSKEKKAYEGKK